MGEKHGISLDIPSSRAKMLRRNIVFNHNRENIHSKDESLKGITKKR